jgi:hypothetical protein
MIQVQNILIANFQETKKRLTKFQKTRNKLMKLVQLLSLQDLFLKIEQNKIFHLSILIGRITVYQLNFNHITKQLTVNNKKNTVHDQTMVKIHILKFHLLLLEKMNSNV